MTSFLFIFHNLNELIKSAKLKYIDLCWDAVKEYPTDDDEHTYLYENLSNDGHHMLGYPYFTQDDPRRDCSDYYDTLLIRIDSEMIGREDYVLWGDSGVGNFFINSKELAQRDFSRVLYNWDCC